MCNTWSRRRQMLAKGLQTSFQPKTPPVSAHFCMNENHVRYIVLIKCIEYAHFGDMQFSVRLLDKSGAAPWVLASFRTPAGATLLHAAAQEGQLEAPAVFLFESIVWINSCWLVLMYSYVMNNTRVYKQRGTAQSNKTADTETRGFESFRFNAGGRSMWFDVSSSQQHYIRYRIYIYICAKT